MRHELKTDPDVFEEVISGFKTFEIRKDDRGFKCGDSLLLRKTDLSAMDAFNQDEPLGYTGEEIIVGVIYILRGPIYGLSEGWVIMSIEL